MTYQKVILKLKFHHNFFLLRLFWFRHAVLVETHPFCMTLDLQLSFCCPLCYNSISHCPLLPCLHTTSAILSAAHSYLMVLSYKCNRCHDLIPNLRINLCKTQVVCESVLTRRSTMKGAASEPTCARVELVLTAVFLLVVGKSSDVCITMRE